MKKFSVMAIALLSMTAPAFAQTAGSQTASTVVIQENNDNTTYGGTGIEIITNNNSTSVGGLAASINGSTGLVNQTVNAGSQSNVGSATNVAISGGYSNLGGNTNAGNPNNPGSQVSSAVLEQVHSYNLVGSSICEYVSSGNITSSNAPYTTAVSNSSGVIGQQFNIGSYSNVGSATNVSLH